MLREITEQYANPLLESTIDEVGKIINGVVIANTRKSKNGYEYSEKAWDSLFNMIEGARNYLDHPARQEMKDRDGVRSIKDFSGVFHTPKRDGDKITANLHATESAWPLYRDIIKLQNEEGLREANATLLEINQDFVLVSVEGYDVNVPIDQFGNSPKVGDEIIVWTNKLEGATHQMKKTKSIWLF